jgi:hypothetical protein
MEDRTEFKCDICKKNYSSYKSRWLHIKKYHNDIKLKNTSDASDLVSKLPQNPQNISKLTCVYCNKELSRLDNLKRHEKNCKLSKVEINKINKLEKQNDEMKKQNDEMQKQIEELKELIQKSMKIHPKTLQKINNQLNMNNNGVINNNFVVQLGYEDFNNVLSEKEKIGLLNKHSNSVVEMVKMVHVNPGEKYKQYKSMYITNLQNNVAYKYDDECKKFIAVSKSDLLDSIIDNRLADIESFHEDYKDKITPFTSKHIQKFIERMSNEKEYKDLKKEELKFAIYNGREEIINQIKENNPDLNIFT